jgi:hypothetical protein
MSAFRRASPGAFLRVNKSGNMSPLARTMSVGAFIGFCCSLAYSMVLQNAGFRNSTPEYVFTGSPGGVDDWIYYALVRAIWRGPNQVTYYYPFCLEPHPPILVQLHLAVISWFARLTGLPLVFEIARVLSTTLCGAALGALARRVLPGRRSRSNLALLLLFGGGLFWISALGILHRTGSWLNFDGMPDFLHQAMGQYWGWLPYLSWNVTLPMETIYHALVLGALAATAYNRHLLAVLTGAFTWFCNPFPAIALASTLGLFWLTNVIRARGPERIRALHLLVWWVLISACAASYYSLLLPRWPELRDLADRHRVALSPPYTLVQLVQVCGPGIFVIAWSALTRAGRRHVWTPPLWRLFTLLVLTQILLVEHGLWIARPCQPHHFNRGYLTFGCSMLLFRGLFIAVRGRRVFPTWAVLLLGLTCVDSVLYWVNFTRHPAPPTGFVQRALLELMPHVEPLAKEALVYSSLEDVPEYIASHSDIRVYDEQSETVIPNQAERRERLKAALEPGRRNTLSSLGITHVIAEADSPLADQLIADGSHTLAAKEGLVLLEVH